MQPLVLGNGHKLQFLASSGAWGFDGRDSGHGLAKLWKLPARIFGYFDPKLFTLITKSLTLEPRKGNLKFWAPWRCIKPYRDPNTNRITGLVNAVGLTNPGIDYWIENVWPEMKRRKQETIVSIWASNEREAYLCCEKLSKLDGLVAVELNTSCPNVQSLTEPRLHDPCDEEQLKANHIGSVVCSAWEGLRISHPLILKLSHMDPIENVVRQTSAYVDAYDVINTIPFGALGLKTIAVQSPLAKYGLEGGVSGKAIKEQAREAIKRVKSTNPDAKIISGGGMVFDNHLDGVNEIIARYVFGARAFSIGSLFLLHPTIPYKIAKMCEQVTFMNGDQHGNCP